MRNLWLLNNGMKKKSCLFDGTSLLNKIKIDEGKKYVFK